MAGRKPLPTRLKLLRGNPGKRRLNADEPQPPLARPSCPRHLGKEARREWRRIVPKLEAIGVLTEIDRTALAAYCDAWGRWVEASLGLQKSGMLIKGRQGEAVKSPYLPVINQAIEQMRMMLIEFGMSPSSRSRLRVPQKAAADPFEAFLAQGKHHA
jgi:P27 family predicted phage terminase small subunit